ncbi:MAG: serine hydrolase [Flavobacteriaceae bacterium]|nr:serine hydrolase [Flavobacteriaceae bacterium]
MLKHIITLLVIVIGLNPICQAQETIIPETVKENIKLRVKNGLNAGIVVGVISSKGTTFYSYGVKSLKSKKVVDENSVFEIGSISKTFTGILLADMVVKGEVSLDDSLQQFLPNGITAPSRNGKSIRLVNMSNHTSSLPDMPNNLISTNPSNPYKDYSEKQLYNFLDSYKLTWDIDSKQEYSNYAVGLLGHILAAKEQTNYENLMMQVIAKPLELENTRILFTSQMIENLAMGHHEGREVENWDLTTFAGAGGIRSTAVDMLKYLAVNMGLEKSNLYPAMKLSHKNSSSKESRRIIGLGWFTAKANDDLEIVWHNGGTAGYRAFVGFIKGGDKGVVVLSNSNANISNIGFHLLHPAYALKKRRVPIRIKLRSIIESEGIETATKIYWELAKTKSDDFDFREEEDELNVLGYSYLGEEEIEKAKFVFKINVEAFPNSSNTYDSYGEALMKNNENVKAIANYKKSFKLNPGNTNAIEMLKKLGVNTEDLTKKMIVEDAILESYVGKYELASDYILTVTKYNNQLKTQVIGQSEHLIFPKSKNIFYYKVVEAQLTFNQNEYGVVESVTLLQRNRKTTGKKIVD